MQIEGLHAHAVHPLAHLIVISHLLCLVKQHEGFTYEIVGIDFMALANVDAIVDIWSDKRLAQAVVFHDFWRGLAIIGIHKDLHQRIGVLHRIPQEFGDHP